MVSNLKEMTRKALVVHNLLHPYCDDITIVGDIRRNRSKIKSIDIVCIVKTVSVQIDLLNFGPVRVAKFINTVDSWSSGKGKALDGKYIQRDIKGTTVNIYMVDAMNYGYMVMFRTGPTNYVKRLVHESLRQAGKYSKGGYVRWIETDEKIPVRKEEDFFELIADPWIIPVSRTG